MFVTITHTCRHASILSSMDAASTHNEFNETWTCVEALGLKGYMCSMCTLKRKTKYDQLQPCCTTSLFARKQTSYFEQSLEPTMACVFQKLACLIGHCPSQNGQQLPQWHCTYCKLVVKKSEIVVKIMLSSEQHLTGSEHDKVKLTLDVAIHAVGEESSGCAG